MEFGLVFLSCSVDDTICPQRFTEVALYGFCFFDANKREFCIDKGELFSLSDTSACSNYPCSLALDNFQWDH